LTGTKHIDRRIMGVRQVIAADVFTLDLVQSSDNPADIGATFKSKVEFVLTALWVCTFNTGHLYFEIHNIVIRAHPDP
jgi:hypothetical protein